MKGPVVSRITTGNALHRGTAVLTRTGVQLFKRLDRLRFIAGLQSKDSPGKQCIAHAVPVLVRFLTAIAFKAWVPFAALGRARQRIDRAECYLLPGLIFLLSIRDQRSEQQVGKLYAPAEKEATEFVTLGRIEQTVQTSQATSQARA